MNLQPITINASRFKSKVGDYLDQSQKTAVFITKYNKKKSVLLNTEYYEALKEQALKVYSQEILDQSKKNKMSEEEILKLVLEAEKWSKKQ